MEGSLGNAHILLGRGSLKDFMSRLRVGGDRNMSVRMEEGWRWIELKETTRKEVISGSSKNLAQGNLPGIYKDDPT